MLTTHSVVVVVRIFVIHALLGGTKDYFFVTNALIHMRQIALDTETTGMNKSGRDNGALVAVGHRIIEIACVEIVDGVVTGKTFHSYINPGRRIDPKATAVHHITDSMIKDSPAFSDIVGDFLSFVKDDELIIHNAPFDTAFLDKEFRMLPAHKQPNTTFRCTDTLTIARNMFPGQDNTLGALCRRYGIAAAVHHSALLDAIMLAHLYVKMVL